MVNQKIQEAINEQINAELGSAYAYLAMAAYLEANDLPGAASWMKHQSEEEVEHAMRFYRFMNERGGVVELKALDAPKKDFASLLDVFETSLKQEEHVTKLIHNLYDLAMQEKDYPFQSFLKWFIDEQVEEEDNVSNVIAKIKLAGNSGPALYLLDEELGEREDDDE